MKIIQEKPFETRRYEGNNFNVFTLKKQTELVSLFFYFL